MKFVVCGSGDAIGIPGIFCRCRVCEYARQAGGKEVRTRTGYYLNDSIKFDFGPDTLGQAIRLGLDFTGMEHLFLTHSHSDHFYVADLWTHMPAIIQSSGKPLHIYGNSGVMKIIAEQKYFSVERTNLILHELVHGEKIRLDDAAITPIGTNHISSEECMMFFIETGKSNILIANDSDRFPEKSWEMLAGKHIDHMFIDCTWGTEHFENRGHMGLPAVLDIAERMRKEKIMDGKSLIYPIHFCHKNTPRHYEMVEAAAKYPNVIPAYDGMVLSE